MARVVSQRSSPPYLLIIFVFLFLVASAVAVLQYLEAEKSAKSLTETQQTLSQLANNRERDTEDFKHYLSQAEGTRGASPQTVYYQLNEQTRDLIELITGNRGDDVATAKAKAEEARANPLDDGTGASGYGLAVQVQRLKSGGGTLNERITALDRQIVDLKKQIEGDQEQMAELRSGFDTERGQLQARISELEDQIKQDNTAHAAQLEEVANEYKEQVAVRDDKLTAEIAKLGELQRKYDDLDRDYRRVLTETNASREVVAKPLEPLGKVMSVDEDNDLCYISLGRNDRVWPGFTFSVFAPEEFGEEDKQKGSLVVMNVGERMSVCRMKLASSGNPILGGDLIANFTFDPSKTLQFVVEGAFNIGGQNRATIEGAEQVRALIQQYGGKISPDLDSQTDFVVMGLKPTQLPKPSPDAPPQVHRVWQDREQAVKRYEEIEEVAKRAGIPILNQNRFVSLIGYEATKLQGS